MSHKMYFRILTCFLVVGLLGGLVLAIGQKPQNGSLPDFSLKDLSGKVHLLSTYRSANGGKVVMLNFWATWCPPCRDEMPSMQKLWQEADKKKFILLAVNAGEDQKTVADFAKKNGYTFPILPDEAGAVARQYRVNGIPTTYLIDRQGRIIKKIVGSREWSWAEIKPLIK